MMRKLATYQREESFMSKRVKFFTFLFRANLIAIHDIEQNSKVQITKRRNLMKGQSLFNLGLSCAIIAAISLPALAQSQSERYLTATEMKQLSVELNRKIKAILQSTNKFGYIREFRTPKQIQSIKSFVNGWSKVDINIAPFLGTWHHAEYAIHIYPTNVKSQVCILATGQGQGRFYGVGTVYNKQLRISNSIYFKQDTYLSSASIIDNSPVLGSILHNQTPLPKLRELKGYMGEQNQEEQDLVIQQFNSHGCLDSLPNRKTTTRASVNTGDFYFVADSAFPDNNSAARKVRKLKNTGYSGAGMFWIPDYPNLSNKPLFQVYPAKFSNRGDCANFLSSYSQSHPAAYCVFGSKDSSASTDRFQR